MFARLVSAAVCVSLLFVGPATVLAEPADSPAPAASSAPIPEHPRDGGIITGKITRVDFQRSIISVNRTQISLMPSTQIQGSDPSYHAITDLKRGMSVEVYTSQVDGKYIAQIITLR